MGSGPELQGVAGTAQTSTASRPEVLLEAPEGAEAGVLWGALEDSGYKVSWCPGPEGPPASWCPLLGGCRCELVESADVVVSALGFHDASCRQVLGELGRLHPEAAVIVEASPSEATRWAPLLRGHQVLPMPLASGPVVDAVDAALGRPGGVREPLSR
jgi:hypothetical protein